MVIRVTITSQELSMITHETPLDAMEFGLGLEFRLELSEISRELAGTHGNSWVCRGNSIARHAECRGGIAGLGGISRELGE